MMPDELKSMPRGQFVVMKTGIHPMKTRLKLFPEWGITFDEGYEVPDHGSRPVAYADKQRLQTAILAKYPRTEPETVPAPQVRTPRHISTLKGGE